MQARFTFFGYTERNGETGLEMGLLLVNLKILRKRDNGMLERQRRNLYQPGAAPQEQKNAKPLKG